MRACGTIDAPAVAAQAIQTMDRLVLLLGVLRSACRGRADLVLANIALRRG